MITEEFINSCFSIILSSGERVKQNKILFRDILQFLKFYEDKESIDISVNVQSKVSCLKRVCEMRLKDRSISNIIDSILYSNKYDKIKGFIEGRLNYELSDDELRDNIHQLRLRKKLNIFFENIDQIDSLVSMFKNGNFDAIDDIVLDYESTVKGMYTKMIDENRCVELEATATFDFNKDGFDILKDKILDSYASTNKTPSGYSILDKEILKGGFGQKRIYVFGGGSGSGKSALLLNFVCNSISTNFVNSDRINNFLINTEQNNDLNNDPNNHNVYIYFTLENSLDETFVRIYQILFSKTEDELLHDINSGIDLVAKCKEVFDKSNSTIVIRYFPSKSISCTDIRVELDSIIEEYGSESIRGLYLDYIDLLSTDIKYDMYRIELGDITLGLKSIAVDYKLPVVTATQLTRAAYKIDKTDQLNLDQMSESIKKVEHSDFVALLVRNKTDESKVHFKVSKNRSGKANMSLDFSVDFSRYKFINAMKVKNDENSSAITHTNGSNSNNKQKFSGGNFRFGPGNFNI